MKVPLALLMVPALLAGCLGGQSPSTHADVPMGQIDGAVVDQLLHPFSNHTVRLVQLDRTDQTSLLGGFTFRDVPIGVYTVTTEEAGFRSDTQVVSVEADQVSRVILQLTPLPLPLPRFDAVAYRSLPERPEAGAECQGCEWAVPLEAERPREVTLEARWPGGPVLGKENDLLEVKVSDGRGFPLYHGYDLTSPVTVSIPGEDLHPDATELRVEVTYASTFMPSPTAFTMDSVMTLYYGATKAEFFSVRA